MLLSDLKMHQNAFNKWVPHGPWACWRNYNTPQTYRAHWEGTQREREKKWKR